MNYKKYIRIACFLCTMVFYHCKNAPNTEGSNSAIQNVVDTTLLTQDTITSTQISSMTTRPVQNFTVVPYQQVGTITARMTEMDLKQLYGDSNVVRVNRGMVQTIVFPNSPNELEIAWKKEAKFKKINYINIRKGSWRTPEGIAIGATKKQLETINGKAVTLFPLGEDDFRVVWNEGKVHPKLAVTYAQATDRVFEMMILF
ncbi:MAG: hypothetical protein U5L45_24870 [Saprospiraceae bacterium]|nr:hypothetical protein [Saprospiraceae bacterium]